MTPDQKAVREFHEKFGHPAPTHVTLKDYPVELRMRLLREEVKEFCDAAEAGDIVEMIDALSDILYVAHGAGIALGVDLEPFFDEVHRSNMAKLGEDGKPIVREDGKVLKPPGWMPPQIKRIFEDLYRFKAVLDGKPHYFTNHRAAQEFAVKHDVEWGYTSNTGV